MNNESPLPPPVEPDVIELIFRVFSRRWPHKFEKTFTDKAARSLWKRDFEILEVIPESINRGLRASAKLDWPPSPAEFAALCDVVEGLPSPEDAWSEAHALAAKWKQPHDCSHPVVWHAYTESRISDVDEATGKKRFLKAYQFASRLFARGEAMRPIPLALPRQSVVPKSPEEIAQNLRYADEKLASLGLARRARA